MDWNLKYVLSYLKSAPSMLSKTNFNHYSKFWHEVLEQNRVLAYNFGKGPGSAVSKTPAPGPGPLYKLCPDDDNDDELLLLYG